MRQVREVHQPQVWDSRVDRSGITKHINDIFESGELEELSNVQKMHISSTKPTNTYTLDVILSVGYRVNSAIATKFRRWATCTKAETGIPVSVASSSKKALGGVMDDLRD